MEIMSVRCYQIYEINHTIIFSMIFTKKKKEKRKKKVSVEQAILGLRIWARPNVFMGLSPTLISRLFLREKRHLSRQNKHWCPPQTLTCRIHPPLTFSIKLTVYLRQPSNGPMYSDRSLMEINGPARKPASPRS